MGPVRRGVLFLLSLLLFASLLGLASSVSTKLTLGSPGTVEKQLAASGFYTSFADNAIAQAQSESDNSIGSAGISFNNPAIVKAAHDALPASFLQQQGNAAIDSNYAWLEGKQPKPDFKIDLTSARQDFANKVGQAVTDRLTSLQPCNLAQMQVLAASGNTNPLTLACLPPTVDPQTEGQTIAQDISSNSGFLSSAVITPDSLSSNQSEPYYRRLAKAPQAYQLSQRLPAGLGALVFLFILFIYAIARPKRRATRRIGVVLVLAGIILLLNKIAADVFFNYVQKHAINGNGSDSMQRALIGFTHGIESQLVRIDMYFGIAFVVLGLLMLLALRAGRKQASRPAGQAAQPEEAVVQQPAHSNPQPLDNYRGANPYQPASGAPVQGRPQYRDPKASDRPRNKPPRLIQ